MSAVYPTHWEGAVPPFHWLQCSAETVSSSLGGNLLGSVDTSLLCGLGFFCVVFGFFSFP